MREIERVRLWININCSASAKLYDMVISTNGLLDSAGWPLSDIRIRIEWPDLGKIIIGRGI